MGVGLDIFSTLQEDKSRLSPSENRIAEIIVNDFEFAVNASIIELAERAEVSPPTVTRFCRRLGCESFSDFKVQLARTAHIGVRYLKPESKSTDPADVAQDIITKAQNALFLLHRSLDLAAIEAAVSHIAKADMIYAFGSGGNSSMIADELQNRLFRLGLRITASSDHSMQLMMAAAARPNDVLIGSSFSGRNMELVRAFELARDTRVKTIALTQAESPVAKPPKSSCRSTFPKATISTVQPRRALPTSRWSIFLRAWSPMPFGRRRRPRFGASSSSWSFTATATTGNCLEIEVHGV